MRRMIRSAGALLLCAGLPVLLSACVVQTVAKNPASLLTQVVESTAEAVSGVEETTAPETIEEEQIMTNCTPTRDGVSVHGRLRVEGAKLVNARGEPVQLTGMSSHGMQWYPHFASEGAIRTTAEYGANLFRVAMYTDEGGYLSKPSVADQVEKSVDAAISLDMYTIIDWHILFDNNPLDHVEEAKAFFARMAERYKGNPAVLYEICNEPNGDDVTWAGQVKPYAEQVIPVIRAIDADAIILVGSGTWSQDIHHAADDPLDANNVMYTLHFYAGTHTQWLRDRIDYALSKGAPIFVSEWGTSAADGSGGVFLEEAQLWLDFLQERGISWANWSLCDKRETSAALRTPASSDGGWAEEDFTESGWFVFQRFENSRINE